MIIMYVTQYNLQSSYMCLLSERKQIVFVMVFESISFQSVIKIGITIIFSQCIVGKKLFKVDTEDSVKKCQISVNCPNEHFLPYF